MYDGIIEIKGIAREPGDRAKVAVESHDDRIDAVGACVGMKGVRIHSIVRELNNENIDVINYTDDLQLFIQRALAPAKLLEVKVDRPSRTAKVHVNPDQASLAIGRSGQNIRLASELTGFKIEIVKEGEDITRTLDEYEIEIDEFKDDFGEELIGYFKGAGYTTANDVIQAPVSELLAKIPGMTIERVNEIIITMKEAFNEEGADEE